MSKQEENHLTTETWAALGLRAWSGHPERMRISHRHNDLELNLVQRGSIVYTFGGRRCTLPANSLVLFWAIAPHQLVESAAETQVHWLTLPLGWFLHQQWPEAFQRAVLNCDLLYDEPVQAYSLAQFAHWQQDLARPSDTRRAIVLLEVEARLRRMADVFTPRRVHFDPAPSPQNQSQAEKLAGWLAEHALENIRVQEAAEAANLHPNYAMHIFRKTYGQTMLAYLTQYRIAYAQQLLVTSELSVTEIALQSGFGSLSQFYAAFKRLCGLAPGAYRSSLR